MTQMISPQEQEMLSAYLDNALTPRERQRLETQLQARPELRAALEELRQTRQLLRAAPALRAPRNFTLTPEMAGLRTRPPRVYPAFQWAFALAMVLFVAVLGGEAFFGSPAAMPAADVALVPQAESFTLEEAPVEQAPMEALESSPPYIPPNTRNTGETPREEETAPGIAESGPALEQTPTPGEFIVAAEPPTPTLEPTFKSAPTEPVEDPLPVAEEPMTTTMMSEPSADQGGGDGDTLYDTAAPAPQTNFWASPWRIPQAILAIILVLSGIGLLVFRRKTML
ncbi:MAG: hypothetical protein Fur0022_18120 [Anaerolineales bacterium]